MTTMNISLPEEMKVFVEQQVQQGGYSTASEYLRELIREARKRVAEDRLEELILEGINGGPMQPMTQEDWAELRRKLEQRMAERGQE